MSATDRMAEPPGITTNIEDLAVRGAHDAIFELMVHCIANPQCPCNAKCIESESQRTAIESSNEDYEEKGKHVEGREKNNLK